MKISLLLSLVALVQQTTCNGPRLSLDPATTSDCIDFYDNGLEETCEAVRDLWGITPEEFHKWNPSVGLDCKPWEFQSYCIFTQEKLDGILKTATTSSATKKATSSSTSTSTSSTPHPSPTVWIAKGCYADDVVSPILGESLTPPGGYTDLTISVCQDRCYLNLYGFAGVQDGNQCWCGHSLEGWLAENQTDCNVPCTGDEKTFCGGKGFFNVFRTEDNEEPLSTAVTTSSVTSSATSSGVGSAVETVLSATQSSGAKRNRAIF